MEIPLYNRRGEEVGRAIVSQEDAELVSGYRWYLDPEGYATTNVLDERGGLRADGVRRRRRVLRMHRLILGLTPGDGVLADHRDRNRLNNTRGNLRRATPKQNGENTPAREGSSSRFRGVTWEPSRGKWAAQVSVNGRNHRLGRFDSEEEAAEVSARFRAEHMEYAEE